MAGTFATSPSTLANLAHLTPRPTKTLFGDNYLSVANMNFTQQFLPDVYEKEIERYGNRTISGFLRMVGAELPLASDQAVWSEQGRLHIAYENLTVPTSTTITLPTGHLIGPGMTIVVSKGVITRKAFVISVTATQATIATYGSTAVLPAGLITTGVKIFVFGSEYAKGSSLAGNPMDASFTTYSNQPIILRDKYRVSGSDVAQIGWVEVTTEIGGSGYLWYLKSEHEARIRFEDQLEMAMIEGEIASTAITNAAGKQLFGTQGLFDAIATRGLVFNDPDFGATGGAGLVDFDTILKELDKQGAIEENMMFLSRQTALDIDNMLAGQNTYGAGGTSYGVFDNSEDMALNLGFSGFRRGSYDFYKTDWKYLNDATTRGNIGDISGVIVPAGTSTVYDQQLGQNISRPFLHIRYRASEADDRRLKSWVTGSVGGNFTNDVDEMNVHFLSERALCVQAANNFVLLKKTV